VEVFEKHQRQVFEKQHQRQKQPPMNVKMIFETHVMFQSFIHTPIWVSLQIDIKLKGQPGTTSKKSKETLGAGCV
jgi:hypothetical protein